jgi:hypothetical protein
VPTIEYALRERCSLQELQELAVPLHLAMLGEVFQRADEFEIMHCHVDYFAFAFASLVRTPVVTTLHGRLDLGFLPKVFARFPDAAVVSISHYQRAPLALVRPHWVGTVYNGIPVDTFPFSAPGDYRSFWGASPREASVGGRDRETPGH